MASTRLAILARFLRFGFLAWGGPVAQIAMLRRELVEEERWISGERFNRLLAVYQALPGPEAHELAVHLGMLRGGRVGGLLAGLGFMLPGFVLVVVIAALYRSVDLSQAWLVAALLGIQVGVVALVLRAVDRIGRHILVDAGTWAIALVAGLATFVGISFWIVLPLAGLAYLLLGRRGERDRIGVAATGSLLVLAVISAVAIATLLPATLGATGLGAPGGATVTPSAATSTPTLPGIFASGLKAGLLTFGGAYTAIPFVRADAVGNGWVTDAQFLDAVALSGLLPAPLIIFATFVGFLAGGLAGAVAITLGIFVPAFGFALVLGDRLEAIVDRPALHRLLEGVAAGVVGIIAVTAIELAAVVAGRAPSLAGAAVILVVALVVLYRWSSRAAVPVVIAGSAVAGWIVFEALMS